MTDGEKIESTGVRFPPPFLFLLGLGVAWFLETRVVRINLVRGAASSRPIQLAGLALLLAGLVFLFWGLVTFMRVRTGIFPMRPATQIVAHGPYRLSRNPMYAGMATAYIGGALIMNSGWALIMLPIVMLALYNLVIKREERYLASAFPTEYGEYRKKVRRWL